MAATGKVGADVDARSSSPLVASAPLVTVAAVAVLLACSVIRLAS